LASSLPVRPSVHRAKLKKSKNKQSTQNFLLPYEKEHVERVFESEKINLRIGLVDFSNHHASTSFLSGHGGAVTSESDTEDISDAEDDGLDIDLSGDEDSDFDEDDLHSELDVY